MTRIETMDELHLIERRAAQMRAEAVRAGFARLARWMVALLSRRNSTANPHHAA